MLGQLFSFGTLNFRGSLQELGTLRWVGSLNFFGTLEHRGWSLAYSVTVHFVGSLPRLGALVVFDSLTLCGTLCHPDSLFHHGSLSPFGSLPFIGTLAQRGSLLGYGTLRIRGYSTSIATPTINPHKGNDNATPSNTPFVTERSSSPRHGPRPRFGALVAPARLIHRSHQPPGSILPATRWHASGARQWTHASQRSDCIAALGV